MRRRPRGLLQAALNSILGSLCAGFLLSLLAMWVFTDRRWPFEYDFGWDHVLVFTLMSGMLGVLREIRDEWARRKSVGRERGANRDQGKRGASDGVS
ncbi:hypothetical protein Msi02_30530 [Microbispora siamensis]|uniref:Uncharacterized protein n=1 Tax=Microbispora siamensis TaxID=564413 RepID=A0ABQ4GLD4_9ACTN|nr:hypothetical protein Msi02_30530 [Microbispora siamensis]